MMTRATGMAEALYYSINSSTPEARAGIRCDTETKSMMNNTEMKCETAARINAQQTLQTALGTNNVCTQYLTNYCAASINNNGT